MIRRCRRLLESPLFQCLFAGLLLILLSPQQQPIPTLEISSQQLNLLRKQLIEQTGTEPDNTLWQNSVKRLISEEILLTEAQALNLDQSPEVSRRLQLLSSFLELDEQQSMEGFYSELKQSDPVIRRFLVSAAEKALLSEMEDFSATPEMIEHYYQSHLNRFNQPAAIEFQHIYFKGLDSHSYQKAQIALEQLQKTSVNPPGLGDPFIHGNHVPLVSRPQLSQLFGAEFSSKAFDKPLYEWQEPIPSDYGYHLVRVSRKSPESTLTLNSVSHQIEEQLLKERQKNFLTTKVQSLRNDYVISITNFPQSNESTHKKNRESTL